MDRMRSVPYSMPSPAGQSFIFGQHSIITAIILSFDPIDYSMITHSVAACWSESHARRADSHR